MGTTIIQHPHLLTKGKKKLGYWVHVISSHWLQEFVFFLLVFLPFLAHANGKAMNYGFILIKWGYLFMPLLQLVYKEIEP